MHAAKAGGKPRHPLCALKTKQANQELLAAKTRLAKKGHKKNRRRPDKHEKSIEVLTPSHHQTQDHANNTSTSPGGGGPAVVPTLANASELAKDGLVMIADGDLGVDIDNMVSNGEVPRIINRLLL